MRYASNRLARRREAQRQLQVLFNGRDNLLIVHYSCESFLERPTGTSPRITSIAVRHEGPGQVASFSIHQVAERKGVAVAAIPAGYDMLEACMLNEFDAHVRAHSSAIWMHWNMRDANYGFAAIAHRHRVLGGNPASIPEERRRDLAALLIDIYGPHYIGHPRLQELLSLNNISRLGFMTGQEEANAFSVGEYVKLHQSTLRKADVIAALFSRTCDGTLKTTARWHEQYGTTIVGVVEAVTDHWAYKAAGALGIVATLISLYFTYYPRAATHLP